MRRNALHLAVCDHVVRLTVRQDDSAVADCWAYATSTPTFDLYFILNLGMMITRKKNCMKNYIFHLGAIDLTVNEMSNYQSVHSIFRIDIKFMQSYGQICVRGANGTYTTHRTRLSQNSRSTGPHA